MLWLPADANACTRIHVPLQERLERFDDVFVGTATKGGHDTVFRIERSLKGPHPPGEVVAYAPHKCDGRVEAGNSYLVVGSAGQTEVTFIRGTKVDSPSLKRVEAFLAAKDTDARLKVLVSWGGVLNPFGGEALSVIADSPALIDALTPALLDELTGLLPSHLRPYRRSHVGLFAIFSRRHHKPAAEAVMHLVAAPRPESFNPISTHHLALVSGFEPVRYQGSRLGTSYGRDAPDVSAWAAHLERRKALTWQTSLLSNDRRARGESEVQWLARVIEHGSTPLVRLAAVDRCQRLTQRVEVPYSRLIGVESQNLSWKIEAGSCRRGP